MVIVEKQAKATGAGAQRYARSLATYMATASRGTLAQEYGLTLSQYMVADTNDPIEHARTERVLSTGGLINGQSVDWDDALAELNVRMDKRSSRSNKPARHVIASVHEDEIISAQACDRMAAVLGEELGCEEGVILWALHGDTNNLHPHFLVLTLDEQGGALPFGCDGRSHEAMQRAIARIEHEFGFRREPGARYEVRDGKVLRNTAAPKSEKRRAPINTATLRWEADTGIESFTRYAQDVLAALIEAAGSWDAVQSALAPLGARIVKEGSGGKIESADGSHKVKLSNVDRAFTWGKLIDRWGDWSEPSIKPAQYEPRILDPERAIRWAAREEQADALHAAVQRRIDRLKAEQQAVTKTAQHEHRERRADLADLGANPVDRVRVRQTLDALHQQRIERIKAEYRDRIAALRDLRAEIAEADNLDDISLDDVAAFDRSLSIDWSARPATGAPPPGFEALPVGEAIQYWHRALRAHAPAFVERGDRIWVNDRSDASVRAALIVAHARHGVVAAHGDKAFQAQAQRLGRELGIEVQRGVSIDVAPPRARSPRIRQRRDAARRWEARYAQAGAQTHVPASRDLISSGPADAASSAAGGRVDQTTRERRAILQHVARLLAADDWDPRDYRRVKDGKGRPGREPQHDISRAQSSRSAAAHVQHDAGRTR